MSNQIATAIINAIQNIHHDAADISLPDTATDLTDLQPANLNITWKANDELHVGHFLAWTGPASNTHEIRVLEAMRKTEIPVPDLVTAGTNGSQSVMLAAQVEGDTIANCLQRAGMRWEISTIAFAYARMLARIHSLDWTTVTPWLEDAESLPEDILDAQVEEEFHYRSSQAETLPGEWKTFVLRIIDWLELRRPVEASLCLCHGAYHPRNVIAVGEDITAVVNWRQARVTDASRDLAMLPVWLNEVGLSLEDAELFAQASSGAYLQASKQGLGNTPYYSVAQPLDQLLERLLDRDSPPAVSELEAMQGTIERAMALAGRAPWKNR